MIASAMPDEPKWIKWAREFNRFCQKKDYFQKDEINKMLQTLLRQIQQRSPAGWEDPAASH
jgi:hypothetical protein